MKLITFIGIALSFTVSAQPTLINVNEFELEYEVAGNGSANDFIL